MEKEDVYFELKLELKKILKQKNNYSYNYLKEKLGFISDDKMIFLFLEIIMDTLNNFNFLTPVYYNKFIFKIFEYLNIRNDKFEIEKCDEIIIELRSLNDKIKSTIKKDFILPTNSTYISNKAFLLNISCQISSTISKFNANENIDLECIEYELCNILRDLIFKIKKPLFVEEMLDIYPGISKVKNTDNNLLFREILDKYINVLLNRDDDYELIYYNKIVTAFINNSNSINDYEIRDIVSFKVGKILSSLEDKEYTNFKKEKIMFFLRELKNLIKEGKEENTSYSEKINHIKRKYGMSNHEPCSYILEKPNWKLYKKSNAYAVTIDSPKAKTLENALSLDITNNTYKLGIYVIDMSAYIKENGITEKIVMDKSISIKGYPLFPTRLANKNFSLKKGKYSYVIAYTFYFDKNIEITNFKVEKKMIKVKANLSYNQVQTILNEKENTRLKKEICQLYTLSKLLNRKENDSKKTYHEIKDIVKVLLYNHEQNIKNKYDFDLVGEYHRFLNAFISKYCYDNKLPYLYRNNNFNSNLDTVEEIKEKYKNDESLKDIIDMLHSIYEPSSYSTENKGHTGLNLEAYGEITKPCRSVVSIINQRLTIDYFINGLYIDDHKRALLISKLNKMADMFNKQREFYDSYSLEIGKIKKIKKR